MAKKAFKAESKRLLDLMIHSIYTHREIFLRELISNASDAIDKLYYRALSDGNTGLSREDFAISITIDKESGTLTVSDNGCGMTKEELENNLGVIAKSGSLDFKKDLEKNEEIDIIGQFGVGFYSSFMVSDHVRVVTKAFGEEAALVWESTGSEGYTIADGERESHGTSVILKIKENLGEENYSEFLESGRIKALVQKYSDYIRYPIKMDVEKSRMKEKAEGADQDAPPEWESYTENETLNSMVPLWKKNKSELTDEDYNSFYKEKFHDYTDPLRVVHSSTEGSATYNALLFIPAKAAYDYYTRQYEKGLELYASGVLIMDKCADLLPDHFSFVKGLVDSQDLSLNISREMLQHDRQLRVIAARLEKKIKAELLSMLQNEREKYDEFYKSFGLQLKYGAYGDFGKNKELLRDLLMFYSSKEEKLVTFSEYIGRMLEGQEHIYYASGETTEQIARLPQTELLREKGYEILYLTDDVDEFCLQILREYEGKEFKSVSASDAPVLDESEKEAETKETEENKALLEAIKAALGEDVSGVKLSRRLRSHPVCLSSEGALSIEMEKVLAAMPGAEGGMKARRVLEINAAHPVFETLKKLHEESSDRLSEYAKLLYDQALLIEGLSVSDPVAFSNAICKLMSGS